MKLVKRTALIAVAVGVSYWIAIAAGTIIDTKDEVKRSPAFEQRKEAYNKEGGSLLQWFYYH